MRKDLVPFWLICALILFDLSICLLIVFHDSKIEEHINKFQQTTAAQVLLSCGEGVLNFEDWYKQGADDGN